MAVKRQKRGASGREVCVFAGTWIPAFWVPKMDALAAREGSGKGKIILKALERKLQEQAAGPPAPCISGISRATRR